MTLTDKLEQLDCVIAETSAAVEAAQMLYDAEPDHLHKENLREAKAEHTMAVNGRRQICAQLSARVETGVDCGAQEAAGL